MNMEYRYYTGEVQRKKMPHEYHNRCFPFTVFVFVCEGTYFCRSDGQELSVGCGETLIVPPHIFHHVKMEESGILNWAHISLLIDDTDLSSVLTAFEKPYKITGICSEKTGECLEKLNRSQSVTDEVRRSILRDRYVAEIYDILLNVRKSSEKPKQELDGIYSRILRNPGEKYTLTYLAKLANMSERSFEEKFKSAYHITPIQHISQCRIKQASFLLALGKSVKETAQITGYYDTYHLSKQFKKAIGISPSEYARTHSSDI